jgi:dihydrofolate reductase
MRISIIAAMDRNALIGAGNGLPWHLPADLAHFKRLTLGKAIIMGRRTYETIGRPLPQRENIVVTRNSDFLAEGCTVVHSLLGAIDAARGGGEMMIIGGESLYAEALPLTARMYLTLIDAEFEGDTWFPSFDRGEWREVASEQRPPDDANPYPLRFVILDREFGAAGVRR